MKTKHALIVALLLAPLPALRAAAAPAPTAKPNLVFIFADDWGWGDLSCHGQSLPYGELKAALAAQGQTVLKIPPPTPAPAKR